MPQKEEIFPGDVFLWTDPEKDMPYGIRPLPLEDDVEQHPLLTVVFPMKPVNLHEKTLLVLGGPYFDYQPGRWTIVVLLEGQVIRVPSTFWPRLSPISFASVPNKI